MQLLYNYAELRATEINENHNHATSNKMHSFTFSNCLILIRAMVDSKLKTFGRNITLSIEHSQQGT